MESYDFTARVDKILKENPVHTHRAAPKCYICNDEGRIQYFRIINEIRYEYCCHCTCEIGQNFIYEGRFCKDKSIYRMASIEEILPTQAINELIEINKTQKHRMREQRKNTKASNNRAKNLTMANFCTT